MRDADAIDVLLTPHDLIRYAYCRFAQAELFYGHGSDNPWDEAAHLVIGALGIDWALKDELNHARLVRRERQHVVELIERRIIDRTPLPYLLHEAWFMELPFYVDERVLIPRSPIAELIEQNFAPWLTATDVSRVLDLCTGSGCIGIACAYQFQDAEVVLSELDDGALDVARRNVEKHGLGDRVEVVKSDLFDNIEGRFEIIVTNPPYVDQQDMASLPEEFRQEPALALASGDDGLDATRIILAQARDYLSDDGLLVVEVGNSWEALEASYPSVPFTWLEFERGGHGVFCLTAAELDQHRDALRAAAKGA